MSNTFAKLSLREKFLTGIAIMLVISYSLFWFSSKLFDAGGMSTTQLQKYESKLKEEIFSKEALKDELSFNIAETKNLEAELARVKKNVVGSEELNSIIILVENKAISETVELVGFSIEPVIQNGISQNAYTENMVKIHLIGAYQPLAFFISRLFEGAVPMSPENLVIKNDRSSDDKLTALVSMKVYSKP